jgi:hypothetical protein
LDQTEGQARLFMALAEELKLPLLHMARQAELQTLPVMPAAERPVAVQQALQDIQASADMSLQLLDSYVLSLRLMLPDNRLAVEPVSLSMVLHDTAQELQQIAASYGVALQVHVQGRYEPVLTNRQALQAALVALSYALIEALPAAGVQNQRLQLATHRTKYGIVAGVYGELEGLTPQLYRRARDLRGQVRQPLVNNLAGSGAGVFVAEAILTAMASRLRVGRYMRLPGFAVTLPTSEQLQLV